MAKAIERSLWRALISRLYSSRMMAIFCRSRTSVARIAVIGPNADNMAAQLGDWTFHGLHESIDAGNVEEFMASLARDNVVTVLDGIRMRADDEIQIAYGQGCDLIDPGIERIAEAS